MTTPAATAPDAKSTSAQTTDAGIPATSHVAAAFAGVRRVPPPTNDPNRTYAPGSPERVELKARLKSMASEKIEIPLVIGGKEVRTGKIEKSVMPHDHGHVLAEYHKAGPEHVQQAIAAAAEARREHHSERAAESGRVGRGKTARPSFSGPPSCWRRRGAPRSTRRRCSGSRRRRCSPRSTPPPR